MVPFKVRNGHKKSEPSKNDINKVILKASLANPSNKDYMISLQKLSTSARANGSFAYLVNDIDGVVKLLPL